jgi:hypothetical protein
LAGHWWNFVRVRHTTIPLARVMPKDRQKWHK